MEGDYQVIRGAAGPGIEKRGVFLQQIVKNNNSENVVLLLFMCFNIFNSFIFNISVILILFL